MQIIKVFYKRLCYGHIVIYTNINVIFVLRMSDLSVLSLCIFGVYTYM